MQKGLQSTILRTLHLIRDVDAVTVSYQILDRLRMSTAI